MTKRITSGEMLAAVEAYAALGFSPWPMVAGKKTPQNVDGRTWGGKRHVPLNADERRRVWSRELTPDVALVVPDGYFVLDLDPKNNPDVRLMFDDLIATTRCEFTPSGGLHAYFRVDGRVPTTDPALGVDVQGHGSLVIAVPSTNYVLANDLEIVDWKGGRP